MICISTKKDSYQKIINDVTCDTYILAKGTITVENTTAECAAPNNRNKKVLFKNWAAFNDYISEINNKEIDNIKGINVVMSMYNLIEYSDNYQKTPGSLRQYYRYEPFINNNGVIIDFPDDPDNDSFKYNQKITDQTENNGTEDVQIMALLKY